MTQQTDEQLLINIRRGSDKELITLYNEYKDDFVQWADRHYKMNIHDSLDVFQDVIIAFYKNVQQKRVEQLTSSLKTYLYAIAKNLIFKKLKYDKRFELSGTITEDQHTENLAEQWEIDESAVSFVMESIRQLGEPCRTILKLYYYEGFSLEAIAKDGVAKNANVVKTQKSRCMKKLTLLIKKRFKPEDFTQN